MSQRYERSESYEHWKQSQSSQVRRELNTKAYILKKKKKDYCQTFPFSPAYAFHGDVEMWHVGNEDTFELGSPPEVQKVLVLPRLFKH